MGAMTEAGQRDWKQNIERIFEWLPILAERRGQFAGTLSGGQQQMLAIGRGLASSPKLLMLDEPSMGLAPTTADFIFERLIEIRRQSNLTILLVEQRVAEALEFGRPRLRSRSRPRRTRRQQPNLAGGRPHPQGLSRHVTNKRSTTPLGENENGSGQRLRTRYRRRR